MQAWTKKVATDKERKTDDTCNIIISHLFSHSLPCHSTLVDLFLSHPSSCLPSILHCVCFFDYSIAACAVSIIPRHAIYPRLPHSQSPFTVLVIPLHPMCCILIQPTTSSLTEPSLVYLGASKTPST